MKKKNRDREEMPNGINAFIVSGIPLFLFKKKKKTRRAFDADRL